MLEAFKIVKMKHGAARIDGENVEMFEINLKDNLYKIWNRISSRSYFSPASKSSGHPQENWRKLHVRHSNGSRPGGTNGSKNLH